MKGLDRPEVRKMVYNVQAAATYTTVTDDRRMGFVERRHLANESHVYYALDTRQVLAWYRLDGRRCLGV